MGQNWWIKGNSILVFFYNSFIFCTLKMFKIGTWRRGSIDDNTLTFKNLNLSVKLLQERGMIDLCSQIRRVPSPKAREEHPWHCQDSLWFWESLINLKGQTWSMSSQALTIKARSTFPGQPRFQGGKAYRMRGCSFRIDGGERNKLGLVFERWSRAYVNHTTRTRKGQFVERKRNVQL